MSGAGLPCATCSVDFTTEKHERRSAARSTVSISVAGAELATASGHRAAIRRTASTAPSMNGTWFGPVLEQWSGCSDSTYNGNHGANAIWSIALYDGVNLSINGNIQTSPSFTCSYSGMHVLDGSLHAASGTFNCSNGKQGNFTTTEFDVTDRGISLIGTGNWTQGGVSCQMQFLIGGYRHLPLP